jgi:hypothetical protein
MTSQERGTGDIVAAVSSYIRRNLGRNLCTFTSCAAFFGMHPRAFNKALGVSPAKWREVNNPESQESRG